MSDVFDLDTNATSEEDAETRRNSKSVNGVDGSELLAYVTRIERLTEEKQGLADDIKDVKAEAVGKGFDAATLNDMLKLRKMKPELRNAREGLRDTYALALGVFE